MGGAEHEWERWEMFCEQIYKKKDGERKIHESAEGEVALKGKVAKEKTMRRMMKNERAQQAWQGKKRVKRKRKYLLERKERCESK